MPAPDRENGDATAPVAGGGLVLGLLAIVATLLAWSVAPLLIRSFRDVVDPHTNNAVRYSMGALLWAPLLVMAMRRGRIGAPLFRRASVPLAWNVVGQVAFSMSFYEIDPGLVTFALRSQIVAVAMIAPLMFPAERLVMRSSSFRTGLFCVIAGVLTMAAIGFAASSRETIADTDPWRLARGFGLAFLAGIGYAGYGLTVRKCLDGVPHTHSFAVVGLMTAVSMVVVMVVASPTRGLVALTVEPGDYARLLATGIIGIGVSHVLFYFAMERLGVALSTGIIQTQPVLVGTASYFIYQEQLLAAQWIFGGVAIAGALTMVHAQHAIHRAKQRQIPELAAADGDVALLEAEQILHRDTGGASAQNENAPRRGAASGPS